MDRVPFQRPEFPSGELIERYFALARNARWFSNHGPCVQLLSDRLAQYVGDGSYCIPVSSGTLGLMVALRAAASPRPGRSEVIVPSFTFIASVSAILWAGFTPVFADVGPDHWHLDSDQLGEALSGRQGRVAAVLACSTFGCAPPDEVRAAWEDLCRAAEVPLIVDSAAGFGSRDEHGSRLGAQGTAEVFSLHATKPLAAGEGGAVLTADRALAQRVSGLTNFGLSADRVLMGEPGLNAKMSEIHAATALAALDGFERVLDARSRRAAAIRAGLAGHGFAFQAGCEASAAQFVPVLSPSAAIRPKILAAAGTAHVQLRTYHEPLHEMAPLQHYETIGSLPVTHALAERVLSLPLANDLTDEEIARIRALLVQATEPS